MHYVIFQTEVTELPKHWDTLIGDLNKWPRLVQIAWIVCNGHTGEKIRAADYIIRPVGFTIPPHSSDVHGITQERAMKDGVTLRSAMKEFAGAVKDADSLLSFNMKLNERVVTAELLRNRIINSYAEKKRICIMETGAPFCKLPGNKPPTLEDLYQTLFNAQFPEKHNARIDAEAAAKCYFEMIKRGTI